MFALTISIGSVEEKLERKRWRYLINVGRTLTRYDQGATGAMKFNDRSEAEKFIEQYRGQLLSYIAVVELTAEDLK